MMQAPFFRTTACVLGAGTLGCALAGLGCGAMASSASSPLPAASTSPAAASSSPTPAASTTVANAAAPPANDSTSQAQSTYRRAALRFEAAGDPFPAPLIDAVVAGQPTTMIADTGATEHVIASWLAAEINLPLTRAEVSGTDHAGRAIAVARLDNARVTLSGFGLIETPRLLVTKLPDGLRKIGIGGVLSPQRLIAAGRAVVLDFRAGSMTDMPLADAGRRIETGGSPSEMAAVRACSGPNEGVRLLVPVLIEGIAADMQLDSGATQSALFVESTAGQRLSGRRAGARQSYAAGGKYVAPVIDDAQVRLGGFEGPAAVELLKRTSKTDCAGDGYVGMDVLRSCVLSMGRERGRLRCKS